MVILAEVTNIFNFHYVTHINLYMIEQPPRMKIKSDKLPQAGESASVIWLQNAQKLPFAQQDVPDPQDEYFKKEHQIYMAQKLKRKQELLKNKLK